MTSGLDSEMAISPNVETAWSSNTGFQVVPLLVDFHMPPEAEAINTVAGSFGSISISCILPPATDGPILRKVN